MPDENKTVHDIESDSGMCDGVKDTFVTSTTPEELFDTLMCMLKKDHQQEDLDRIEKAYRLARNAHKEQKRKSGEPYIVHPLCVAIILAQLDMDADTIIGGILHDIVEDTETTREDVAREFGEDVAYLVDGVTKLTNFKWSADKTDKQAENLRKMFIAMARDIRVVVIKLADRLHNMRTLQYMKPEKQKEKARETRDIYAPIAQRLGISCIKVELDDLAIKYLEPDIYKMLEEKLALTKEGRDNFINNIIDEVNEHLDKYGLGNAHVEGRVKHFFSIYKKMVNQNKTLDQIYDVFAIRIIVDSEKDCYTALGAVHELYKPILGRFKDYIAMPKANMYRSLHTTVIAKNGQPFEIQIRTWDMHKVAEYGIAAHWRYKEEQDGIKHAESEKNKMLWLREILEIHNEMEDNHEFLSLVKNDLDLFNENVYCFTPSGDHKTLPYGSTIVDFAYSVHTAVGNKMVGAKVNGKLTPIDYVIQNGDRIEILVSSKSPGPSKEWLSLAKSAQARSRINQWFRTQNKDDNIAKGKKAIEEYCKEKGIDIKDITKPEYINIVVHKYGYTDWESVLAAVGHGGMKESRIVNKLTEEFLRNELPEAEKVNNTSHRDRQNKDIIVKNDPTASVKFSKCCNPVPGDDIVGYYTKGGVVSIHRKDCINVKNLNDEERKHLVQTEWTVGDSKDNDGRYNVGIDVYANNRIGMFAELSSVVADRGIDILSLNARNDKKKSMVIVSMSFEVRGKTELKELTDELNKVPGVIEIQRTTLK